MIGPIFLVGRIIISFCWACFIITWGNVINCSNYNLKLQSFQLLVAENTESYQYTFGVDTEDVFLFCHNVDKSVQLSDIQWRRQGRIGFFPNPLDLHRLGYLLQLTNTHSMECFDSGSDNVIINVPLNVQGRLLLRSGPIKYFNS